MNDEPSDAEIAGGLRAGERWAWDALCSRYSQRLWRHVGRLIGSDHQAVADVFQETMLAVARSGRNMSEDSNLWAWLARVGHNQAALFWRRHYRDRAVAANLDTSGTDLNDPAEAMARMETVMSIRHLLSQMDADHVTLLSAKYIDGLSVAQIVQQVGGTTESVRSRLARAKRDFRERYQRVAAQ